MKKFLISLTVIIFVLTIPVLAVVGYCHGLGQQYQNTYLAGMADKYARLKSIDEPKIVLVGGSNLPFGIDSALIEKEIGYKVVNLGLYAALGSKTTMDISKTNINKGDIVIFVPEFSGQTYSNYINGEIMLQMLDSNKKMVFKIPGNDWFSLVEAYPGYIKQKREFKSTDTTPNPTGVYSRGAFNEYGDIGTDRPYNIMLDGYDKQNMIDIDSNIINSDFVTYFNDYAKYIKRHKAKLFFSFPPVNNLALTEDNFDKRLNFYNKIKSDFDATLISNIEDYILDEGYFYDTNYHLNDSGVLARTITLIGDIKRELGINTLTSAKVPKPSGNAGGGIIPDETPEDVVFAKNFTYEIVGDRAIMTGLSKQGKTQTAVTVPRIIEGKWVYKIADNAFRNCAKLTKIVFSENIVELGAGIFDGASNLINIELRVNKSVDAQLPSVGTAMMNGASSRAKIYVPKSKYAQMKNDYFWAAYSNYLAILTE